MSGDRILDWKPPENILSLAMKLVDDGLEEGELKELRAVLDRDPIAANWLVDWVELNVMLQSDLGSEDAVLLAPRPLLPTRASDSGTLSLTTGLPREPSSVESPSPTQRNSRLNLERSWRSKASIAIATCLLIGVSYLLGINTASLTGGSSEPIATHEPLRAELATVVGGVSASFEAESVSVGSRIRAGTVRLEYGVAEIVFDKGAVVILQGPAELEIVNDSTCRLVSGAISAKIAPDTNGFQVLAADMRIAEHDAEFGLLMTDSAATEVHVFDGELELVDSINTGSHPLHLARGEALRFGNTDTAISININPNAFVSSADLAERKRLVEQRAYARWLGHAKRWRDDPAVLLNYQFDLTDGEIIRNSKQATLHPARSRQAAPRWMTGRWSAETAMLFDGRTDVLDVEDHPELRLKADFTLAAWIRIRTYSKYAWTRIAGKGNGADRNYGLWLNNDGHLLWQVCQDEDPASQADWDRYSLYSDTVPLHEWVYCVGVVGDGRMDFYVNGKLVNSAAAPKEIATSSDPLTIGYYADVPSHNDYFCGEIDELMLMNRAMSAREVRDTYNLGLPTYEFSREADTDDFQQGPTI